MIDICHLDEAGFAMTQPTTSSWYFAGERLVIPYEAPQGRRLNVIGAYFSHGPGAGRFEFESRAALPKSHAKTPRMSLEELAEKHGLKLHEVGPLDADCFVKFVWTIAGRPFDAPSDWRRERPLYVVLDNYSVHKGEVVRSALPALEAADIHLFYLPSYSPELSEIEPIWKAVKYRELTTRSCTVLGDLKREVDGALTRKAEKLMAAPSPNTSALSRVPPIPTATLSPDADPTMVAHSNPSVDQPAHVSSEAPPIPEPLLRKAA